MTSSVVGGRDPSRVYASANRDAAVGAARRHSSRVRVLKILIIGGAFFGIALLLTVAVVDPFSKVPNNVSIASASLSGTKITMELPRLNGFRKDGKPYQVRARTGIQDIRSPKSIELTDVEARIQVEETNSVSVIAPKGIFDSGADLMKLSTETGGELITLKSDSGFVAVLKSADVNLKAGSLVSHDAVTVRMPNGTISANGVVVSDSGKMITFEGNVRTLFNSRDSGSPVEAEPNE